MNSMKKDPITQMPMPFIYKMVGIVMLRSWFKPGQGLEKNLEGIIESIIIP